MVSPAGSVGSQACVPPAHAHPSESLRRTQNLFTGRIFDGGFAAAGVKDAGDYTTDEIVDPSFNDLGWRTVDVPHDFSIEGEKVKSSSDAQAYLEGGLGYYRKRFTVPASMSGNKTISLDFEGVYQNSVVYLNGEKIGSYPSGYTGFALDITKKVKYGEENVLVVKVQNMSPSGRWYTGSGIIRPVHLLIDNQAHFNRNGITLTTPTLEDDYTASKTGALNIEATGYSDSTNSNVYMEVTVLDADGKEVAKKSTEKTAINPSTAFTLSLKERDAVEVSNVNLWYPWNLGTPYLYKVKVDLYQEINGSSDGYQLIDTEETEYGFRWVKVKETTSDPTSGGLYVNGQYTKVQGVDLHHDSGALGAASYSDAYDREFDKLMAMGVNAYRTSHCPPSKQAIEVCRRKGILVVEEAFDGWGKAKATYDFGNFFFQEVPSDWAGLKPNGYTQLPQELRQMGLEQFCITMEKIACDWFDEKPQIGDSKYETIILLAGAFGITEWVYASRQKEFLDKYKIPCLAKAAYIFDRSFMDYHDMKVQYPILRKLPFLLPCTWVLRFFRIMLKSRTAMKKELQALGKNLKK